MPLFYDRSSLGTSINIETDTPKRSNTTFTAARKFFAPDLSGKQDARGVTTKTNDEHLVEQAAGLKGLAMGVESTAQKAILGLQLAREQLSNTPGENVSDVRSQLSSKTEFDVSSLSDLRAQELAAELRLAAPVLDGKSLADDLHKVTPGSVFKVKLDTPAPSAFNSVVPSLNNVSVDLDKNKGTVDCFYARLKFTLPISQVWNGKIKAVRVFRSTLINPTFSRQVPVITVRGLERLSTSKMKSRSKGLESTVSLDNRYREANIPTAISILSPVDPQTNLRMSTDLRQTEDNVGSNSAAVSSKISNDNGNVSSFLDAERFGGMDSNIAQDPSVIRNIQRRDPSASVVKIPDALVLNSTMPLRQGLVNRDQLVMPRVFSTGQITVAENNSQEFREIAVFSLDKLKSTIIGDIVEYEFLDESIGFGRGYRYYISSIDRDMIESVRSQIVSLTVEGIRVPNRPKRVFSYNVVNGISLNIIVDDQLVEKFEIFRKENTSAFARGSRFASMEIANTRGFNLGQVITERGANGFVKIGECLNASLGQGSSFYDRDVLPGLKYDYRIYSVDIFGNKSESPYEVSLFVPEKSTKTNELLKPSLTAEVDSTTGKARLTFKCADARVRNLFLSRRDLTIGQKAFTAPSQVNRIKLGNPKAGEGSLHFEDIVLRGENKDVSWTGMFENSTDEIVYIDKTVHPDHIYQYRIHGIDLYGNSTTYEISKPFLVVNRPMVSAPVNLTAEVVQGPGFTVGGVVLRWQEGNVTFPSEDMMGNQDSLSSTSVRTLYQIERKKVGEERWAEFPLIPDLSFFDPSPSSLGDQKPEFRPSLIESNQRYVYRVKALQTGTFVSNYGNSVEVFAGLPTLAPTNFRIRPSDAKVKPFYVVLNWDTPNQSGVIDRWEIERAEINNFAASRLNVKNPSDFQNLIFVKHRVVFRESSRFVAQGLDILTKAKLEIASSENQNDRGNKSLSLFTGDHQFQDTDVRFGNTYFYRIRALGVDGIFSNWIYRGVKLAEDGTQKVMENLLTPELQKNLSNSLIPIFLKGQDSERSSTFSLQPSFSKPDVTKSATVGAPSSEKILVQKPLPLPTYPLQNISVKQSEDSLTTRAKILEGASNPILFRGF